MHAVASSSTISNPHDFHVCIIPFLPQEAQNGLVYRKSCKGLQQFHVYTLEVKGSLAAQPKETQQAAAVFTGDAG